ncbi:hypothetical protein [Neosynechococcus sphagnicola]|uniref:hypothetical protein n=1 Tax=Neosynechococcus sphagnicola TaxID=1501145 RepID=UPI0019553738|nr:hypothetical protein [Neosynechococcus sphagnicola]
MSRAKSLADLLARKSALKVFSLGFLVGLLLLLAASQGWGAGAYAVLQQLGFTLGEQYEQWFSQQSLTHPLMLLLFSFVGGLFSSIYPLHPLVVTREP